MRIYDVPAQGPKLRTEGDALDLIAGSAGAACVAIPVERLGEDFFHLQTRVAGGMLQKFVTYRRRVAMVGDVYECDQGRDICFVATRQDLEARLA